MRRRVAVCLALAASLAEATAGHAAQSAPEPRKSIDIPRFMGRWYEILRTPNKAQSNCYAAYQVWNETGPGRFTIAQVCHRDSPSGPEHRIQTGARTLDPPTNAKFEASFFAGLIRRDYWVLDHADDYSWMIASTSNGRYVGVLARKPDLTKREVDALSARVAAMGLDAAHLVSANDGAD